MPVPSRSQTDAQTVRERNRELSILNTIAEALNREVDLARALRVALAHVTELLKLQTGWIWLLREETGGFYLAAAQNLPPALADCPACMEGSCYCLDTYQAGDLEGAANINVVTCSRLKKLVEGTHGLRYHASIPLYAKDKKLGVLNVASPDWQELSPDTLRLLHTIGDLLSIAIERARLYERSTQVGAVEERNRLAREIHDTIAQGLTATILQLEMTDALLEEGNDLERARRSLARALELTRANLEEARRSVLDLRAAPLEGRSLPDALHLLLQRYAEQQQWQVEMEVIGENRPLPVRLEAGLYRITQEALTNVARHANATQVRVELVTTPEQLQLTIEDNGEGFDPSESHAGRFGLVGLNERARLLGGALDVRSAPQTGTIVHVAIPLEAV